MTEPVPVPNQQSPLRLPEWLWAALVGVATFLVYLPCMRGEFVWDDPDWTVRMESEYRSLTGLWNIWMVPGTIQQYYPLTGTSFLIDYQLWGFNTLPYHVENVVLHALSALLFWRLLKRLEVPGAGFAAAVFALHPVMVESVAWITERKNVLSMVFLLASLLAYQRFDGFGAEPKMERRSAQLWLALLWYVAALLAKVTAFALPGIILVLIWWRRGRLDWRRDVVPVLPMFALSIAAGAGAYWMETQHLGAKGEEWYLAPAERFLVAGRALWFYAGKLLVPLGLTPMYERWELNAASPLQWLWPITAVAAFMALAWQTRRIGRHALAVALLYAGALSPVLGFLNVYGMIYTFVADRWTYVSALPVIAWCSAVAVQQLNQTYLRKFMPAGAALVLGTLGLLTWQHADVFGSHEKLLRSMIRGSPKCWAAQNNLGTLLMERGDLDEGTEWLRQSVANRPTYAEAWHNLGNARLRKGLVDEAEEYFRKALALKPDFPESNNNLGNVLLQTNRAQDAIPLYRKALEQRPDYPEARNNLGSALLQTGVQREALGYLEQAYQQQPNDMATLNNVAWLLATAGDASLRNAERSVTLAERANTMAGGSHPAVLRTLAAAYAEAGRFADAIATAEKAQEIAVAQGQGGLAETISNQLELHRAGQPLHIEAASP